MKREDFLPEQRKVLNCTDKNLIVSASAGSGKTTVMIQKIIELITEQNKSVKDFLILTYTVLAAEEMNQKLINALYEKTFSYLEQIRATSSADTISTIGKFTDKNEANSKQSNVENLNIEKNAEKDLEKNVEKKGKNKEKENSEKIEKKYYHLLSQIDEMATADISTIHGFFQRLLKKYFMLLNLEPNFKILEESQAQVLKNQALKNAIVTYGENSRERLNQLLDIYGKSRSEKTIFKLLEKINVVLKAIDDAPFWCENIATKLCEPNLNKNYAIKTLNRFFCDSARYYEKVFEKLLKETQLLSEAKYTAYVQDILIQLNLIKLNEKETEKNFFTNYGIIYDFNFETLNQSKENPDLYKKIFFQREKLKEFINKIKAYNYSRENVCLSVKSIKQNIETLLDLCRVFDDEYTKLKKESSYLDYNDLEKYALELAENKDVCRQISKRYTHLFVDEYQDANRLQERILSAFASGGLRFMVGDLKQSIYGFRQAEPDIFLNLQSQFSNSEDCEVMFLNSNFRSHPRILNFVNTIFCALMTETTAKLDYAKKSCLQGRIKFPDSNETNVTNAGVEINIIRTLKEKKEPQTPNVYSVKEHTKNVDLQDGDEQDKAEKEAILIAQKIGELIGKKFYDSSIKAFREIEFKDISILLNSRGSYLDKLCTKLSEFNIPIYANANKSLLGDEDIYIFIHLLELCKNFNNDIALASCLHSVFGGLNYAELAQIRFSTSNCKYFYECVNFFIENYKNEKFPQTQRNAKILNNEEIDFEEIYNKLNNFKILIDNLKFEINIKGIYFALNKVVNSYDYFSYLYSKNNGLEKANNLKKFLNDFIQSSFDNDLIGFLNFVRECPEAVSAPDYLSSDNCVNINTIHSSKGLEFPVVFLANAGASFEGRANDNEIAINLNFGIGLKFYNPIERTENMSFIFDAITKLNKDAEFAEKIRLLYVALTRAKYFLFIVGSTKNDFEKLSADYEIKQKNNYLDLIIGAMPEKMIKKINVNKNIIDDNFEVKTYFENEISNSVLFENDKQQGESNSEQGENSECFENGGNEKKLSIESECIIENESNGENKKVESKEKYFKIFQDFFNKNAPAPDDVALKNSVTYLAHESEQDFTSINPSPKSLRTSEHLSDKAAEIGILYHKVLERIDFQNIDNEFQIKEIIQKNFSKQKDLIDEKLIFGCVKCLQSFKFKNLLKEQKFMMYIPHREIIKNGSDEKVLIQGIADLILLDAVTNANEINKNAINAKNILIDYKYTSITDENLLKKRYETQLRIYKKAVETALNIKIDEVYLLLIKNQKLLKIFI
ncbi:MAG: UvrD-helicase domain-containing protein [Clostridia bacterium]|nr:UvrD-helicase domain-containing protein [Clostridia bacterium]